jgi:hypothetical protein
MLVACNGEEPNAGDDDPGTLQNEIPEPEPEIPEEPEVPEPEIPEPSEPVFTLMDTFDFGEVRAVVEHDEDFNIYINFTEEEDTRIFVFSDFEEGSVKWLISTAEGAATRHLEVFEIRDMVTDKPFYCIRFYFAAAPYNVNILYILDAENKTATPIGVIEAEAVITKEGDDYSISFDELGIERDIVFYFRNDPDWLIELQEKPSVDVMITFSTVDSARFTDYTIVTHRAVFTSEDNGWIMGIRVAVTYEFHDGVLTPVEFSFD